MSAPRIGRIHGRLKSGRPTLPRTLTVMLSFFSALVSLCVFMTSSAVAKDDTPTNKSDCLAVSQTLYRQAERLSKRTKQIIPREFARVAANLDEFCGEENFEKARIRIDWMNTCLFVLETRITFVRSILSRKAVCKARDETTMQALSPSPVASSMSIRRENAVRQQRSQ
jgi:hypothetical protein